MEQQNGSVSIQEGQQAWYKARICLFVGWSDLEYAEHQYNTGLEYLRLYIPNDPAGADTLIRSRIFWQWWKNHWSFRDAYFIRSIAEKDQEERRNIYIMLHSPVRLASAIYPGRVILDNSYAEMIGRLFDSNTAAV